MGAKAQIILGLMIGELVFIYMLLSDYEILKGKNKWR